MNNESELPADVLGALRLNRKVDAIKLLREHRNLELKEAKQIIDAHIARHPARAGSSSRKTEFGFAPLLFAGLATAVAYALYRFFS